MLAAPKPCAALAPNTAEVVEAVNFNDPMQTVIAGSKAAVEKACEVLKANGAKRALPLPVSAPFHSSLMKPAADKLRERLAATAFAAPQIPVINNIDVAVETDPDRIRDALYRQAFGPVRWVECVQAIKARGITTLVECGPGKVLAGMVKRIDAELTGAALFDPASLAEIKGAAGMSECKFEGQVALVTGASRGIGAAIALELAQRGLKVIGTATTDEGAAKISQALAAFPGCDGKTSM